MVAQDTEILYEGQEEQRWNELMLSKGITQISQCLHDDNGDVVVLFCAISKPRHSFDDALLQ